MVELSIFVGELEVLPDGIERARLYGTNESELDDFATLVLHLERFAKVPARVHVEGFGEVDVPTYYWLKKGQMERALMRGARALSAAKEAEIRARERGEV